MRLQLKEINFKRYQIIRKICINQYRKDALHVKTHGRN